MKNINTFALSFLTLFILINTTAHAQTLLLEENFDYPVDSFDDLITTSKVTEWRVTNAGNPAYIVTGSLSYSGYPATGIGNMLHINGSGTDYRHDFSSNISSGSLYWSFLLEVVDNTSLKDTPTVGDYFINFQSGNSGIGLLSIRNNVTTSKYQLGLQKKSGSTAEYITSKELNYGETYLIVVAYAFISSTSTDDQVKLWINPSLNGAEPAPDLTFIDTETDPAYINMIQIRQGANTPNAYIDGIRVSDSWSEAPLPVELTNFTSKVISGKVNLFWQTANEINNYGFEIQRSIVGNKQSAENREVNPDSWIKIGFVKGAGNSNSSKNYSFIDDQLSHTGIFYYRLKQIDNDGEYKYSKVISVNNNLSLDYNLEQNYPNPFNPNTSIKFSLPESGFVSIKLYNLLGREVRTIINEYKAAGSYLINFSAGGLCSGVYYYKISTGSYSSVKKMIFLK